MSVSSVAAIKKDRTFAPVSRTRTLVLKQDQKLDTETMPTLLSVILIQTSGVLTCVVVVCVVALPPATVDAQEGFIVIVLVPVKGGDSGESALSVATYQAGGSGHHLPERQIVLEEGSHDLEKLPGAIPLE